MQELPILEAPETVLHLIQNIMILLSFLASLRWGWREFRVRRNGNGYKRRASDTLPGTSSTAKHNPSPEYHELKDDMREHKQWSRTRDEHHTTVIAKIGQRIANIEGRLAKE